MFQHIIYFLSLGQAFVLYFLVYILKTIVLNRLFKTYNLGRLVFQTSFSNVKSFKHGIYFALNDRSIKDRWEMRLKGKGALIKL